jgi:riboflavin biosynthesis pyrimidine reductase
VFANMVSTTDGAGSFGGVTEPISSATDKQLFSLLRSMADVILVGAATVRAERYGPARTPERYQRQRTDRGQAPFPAIAVCSGSLQLDWGAPFFTEAKSRPLVVTMAASPDDARRRAAEVADVMVAGDDRVDLAEVLRKLRERGCSLLLTEGGPTLLGELATLDVVDELCLALSPIVAGGDAPRITTGLDLDTPQRYRVAALLEDDDFLFLRYLRAR